jgi:hypothetical protein
MPKMDYKKLLSELYQTSAKEVREVLVPPLSYLMIDGSGDPNTAPEYAQAVEALFSVSYTAKFALKKSNPELDYAVMPLEGLWWADDFSVFQSGDRQQWQWTMMILQPPLIDAEKIESAIQAVRSKKSLPALEKLRFQQFTEGRCAQTLHIGPFTEEGPTIQRVHDYIEARSTKRGKHHEIYLSDVRRADPQKWKTILRQPME